MNFVFSFLYRACEWITRLAFVNILWIAFMFVGFIVFGFFPATIAMFTVIRKWIMGDSDIPVFKTFWITYKKEWAKSNLLGGLIAISTSLIMIDMYVLFHSPDQIIQISMYPILMLAIIFSLLVFYVFPTYVHYDLTVLQVIRNSFLIMLINPYYNIIMILGLVLLVFIGQIIPSLAVCFGGSMSAYIIMWSCYKGFLHVQKKKEIINTAKP